MIRVRIKAILHGCDFRLSDARLYEQFRRSPHFPGDLEPGEVYLFVAASQRQLIWFLNQESDNSQDDTISVTFCDSRRWRFTGNEQWEPNRLAEYAKRAGLKLKGIDLFSESFDDYREFLYDKQKEYRANAKARKAARKKKRY